MSKKALGLLFCVLLGLWSWSGSLHAQSGSTQRAVGFSNLVFRPAGGDEVGIANEDFRIHILEHLRSRGLKAVGAENLVFGADRGGQAELVLGGTVTELECVQAPSYDRVSCRMGVEWQVLDVRADSVVYKVLSRGRVEDMPKEPVVTVGKRLIVATLDALLGRPGFKSLLVPAPAAGPARGYPRATLRACAAPPRDMPGASEQVLDATVLVQTTAGFGSGFSLSSDGFIVTAAHVVPGASATVRLRDGREFPGSVIRVNRQLDVALLRLGAPEGTPLPCLRGKLDPVAVGADVYAIGSPASRDLSFSLARGIVSGVRLLDGVQYLQTDAAINSGNSGGPLVTAQGEAAAVVSFKLVGGAVEGIAFGVPLGAALNAIGVTTTNAFTSPELMSAAAVPASAAPTLFEDTADPQPRLAPPGPKDTRVQGVGPRKTSPVVKRTLLLLGGTALFTGALLLPMYYSSDYLKDQDKTGIWALTGAGAVVLGIGVALP